MPISPGDPLGRFRWQGVTLFLGAIVILVGLVVSLQLVVEFFWWTRYTDNSTPPGNTSQQEKMLREKLDFYAKNADELKELAGLIVGLSTLYGISLGVGSYLNVKQAKDQFDSDRQMLVAKVDSDLLAIRKNFPLFRDTERAIQDIRFKLQKFIPDADYGRDVFEQIDPMNAVMIEHYERSVGTLEFFDLTSFSEDAGSIYHMLGSYYSHKYEYERKRNDENSTRDDAKKLPDLRDLFRAGWYLQRAREISPKNIGPLNEIGYLEVVVKNAGEEAVPYLRKSLQLEDNQQRARYYLAIVEHLRGNAARSAGQKSIAVKHYAQSVSLLSEALERKYWQSSEEPGRFRRAILYNRACGYARVAEGTPSEKEARVLRLAALKDLQSTFPADEKPDKQRKVDLENDLLRQGDLRALAENAEFTQEVRYLVRRVRH